MCATIRKFDAFEKLNKDKPIEGLVLIVAITPDGLEISVDLPKTFTVRRNQKRFGFLIEADSE